MELRTLGASGLRVSAIGLGSVRFGDQVDADAAKAVVDAALDAGITLIDTADEYTRGRSEEALGRILQGRRDDVVLATKFGADTGDRNGTDFGARASRRYIVKAVESSLRRLRTDYIDLYQLHMPDHVTPIEETLAALDSLIAAGKVRYAGASNLAAWEVGEAAWIARERRLSGFVSIQDDYSLLNRDAESELLPACRSHDLGFLAFFPLGTGLLTGRWSRGEELVEGTRMWQCRSVGLANDHTAEMLEQLSKVADEAGITLTDLALQWLLSRDGVTAAITGASTPEQIVANAAALDGGLSAGDLAEIDQITGVESPTPRPPTQRQQPGGDGAAGAISDDARRAAAQILLQGRPFDDAVAVLVEEGVPAARASKVCQELLIDPVFEAGMVMSERLLKLDSILTMRQTMRELTDYGSTIERRDGVDTEEFLEIYYAGNLPVVLTDVCADWAAKDLWTPDYLAAKLGDAMVEVTAGRDDDPRYEVNADEHKAQMTFSDYVRQITERDGNDIYIVANNHLLESPSAQPLWADFAVDERYLEVEGGEAQTFLWFGPAGTVTPLHHDVVNVLFAQVTGIKRFTLISPLDTNCVYNDIAVYSLVDPRDPQPEVYPRFEQARKFEVTVGPGDALFIPAGWWHQVESDTMSASISFTNFRFPNRFDWYQPNAAY